MKRGVSIAILVFTFCLSFFELQAKEVTLISIGDGATKELAVRNALISAVEQVCGVYNLGSSIVLDDELIRDQIVQIERGNIQRYTILNEAKIGENTWSATVEVSVSPDNLLKFVRSKGYDCEFSGETFAVNLALHKLYLRNGVTAMEHLYETLELIVPTIYDFKLNLGEPIVYKSDVYVPVVIDCMLNVNYATFLDIYNTTYSHIQASIESIPIQGRTNAQSERDKINTIRETILKLPEIWIFGFKVYDNNGASIVPTLFSTCRDALSENFYWPSNLVFPYKYNDRDRTDIAGLEPYSYILYQNQHVLRAVGLKIQPLDYEPLCSLNKNESGGKVLKPYVRKVEDKFSSYRALGHTGVYDIRDFDSKMIDWRDGDNTRRSWHGVINEFPTAASVGQTVCTIHFFLCYKDTDIAKVKEIKIKPFEEDLVIK